MPNIITGSVLGIIPGAQEKIMSSGPIPVEKGACYIDQARKRESPAVIHFSSKEEEIGLRSLWNQVGITYKGAFEDGGEDIALQRVYEELLDVELYPVGSVNVLESLRGFPYTELLSPEELERTRTHYAPVIEIGRVLGVLAARGGETVDPNSEASYRRAVNLSDEEFAAHLLITRAAHRYRIKFWRDELESVAEHPAVNKLLEAIRVSHDK